MNGCFEMTIEVRKFRKEDLPQMVFIWNEVVEEGIAFPQLDLLDNVTGESFFAAQTYSGVAVDADTNKCFL